VDSHAKLAEARPQPKRPPQNAAKGGFRPKIPSSASKTTSSSTIARTSSPIKKEEAIESPVAGLGSGGQIKSGIEDWVGGDDWYEGPKRERGGRKKRKKEKEQREREEQNWDAVYDPTRPTRYEAYKDSDERIRELEDWMALLRGNRRRRDSSMRSSRSESEEYARQPMNRMYSFIASALQHG
jgi:splicing factor 45